MPITYTPRPSPPANETPSVLAPEPTTELGSAPNLDPDSMLAYCASRLNSIDSQITSIFQRQQAMRAGSSAINRLQEKINTSLSVSKPSGVCQLDTDDGPMKEEIRVLFQHAINALPDTCPQKATLKAQYDNYVHTLEDGKVSVEELNALNQVLTNVSKDISGSSELDMITLQSALSQRQTAIQLCTNVIASLSETSKLIAQKIG